ncbi:MAG: hypothetical protein R2728_09540 [Chitinophagales bacterium]
MSLNQRKTELINWISAIENESLLIHLQELKKDVITETPAKILSLLELSTKAVDSELTKHTKTADLLK